MQKIADFIDNDEKILWKREKNRNLTSSIPVILICDIIGSVFFGYIFGNIYYVSAKVDNHAVMTISLVSLIVSVILYNILMIYVAIFWKKERYGFFNQDKKYMKNYMEEDVLTNKKIIQKNYYNMYRFMKHIKNREKEGVIIDLYKLEGYKLIEDISILEINAISKVIVKWDYKLIDFHIKDYQDGYIIRIDSGMLKRSKAPIRECVSMIKNLIPSEKLIIEPNITFKEAYRLERENQKRKKEMKRNNP